MAKVAIVTGGTRGIGAAIAKTPEGQPATRSPPSMPAMTKPPRSSRHETGIAVYRWDVSDVAASAAGVEPGRGGARPGRRAGQQCRHHPRRHVPQDELGPVVRGHAHQSQFDVHHDPPGHRGHARAPGAAGSSSISSINGQKGQLGQANYSASKAGIIGFTKALAQENARKGITVNAICPGYIDTDMVANVPEKVLEAIVAQIPVGRLGQGGGDRRAGRLPRLRRGRLHHRRGAHRQWRAVHRQRLNPGPRPPASKIADRQPG